MGSRTSRIDIIGQNGNDGAIYHHLHKHGHRPKSGCSPTYSSWVSMKARCSDVSNANYHGKGVSVCPEWVDFIAFLADMGDREEGTTLDRIDPSGNYCASNCRWASSSVQSRNKSTNIFAEVDGVRLCLVDLSEKYGVAKSTIYRRYKDGLRGSDLVSSANRNKFRTGERCGSSKLNELSVSKIKEMLIAGKTQTSIALIFNVSAVTISDIKRGVTWAKK